jgi:hypothetical protein
MGIERYSMKVTFFFAHSLYSVVIGFESPNPTQGICLGDASSV